MSDDGFTDITKPFLSRSNAIEAIDRLRAKLGSYSLIKTSFVDVRRVMGKRTSLDTALLRVSAVVGVVPIGMPGIQLEVLGDAEYRRGDRRIYLTQLTIGNDPTGISNKLIHAAGIAVGRSLHVSEADDALFEELLPVRA